MFFPQYDISHDLYCYCSLETYKLTRQELWTPSQWLQVSLLKTVQFCLIRWTMATTINPLDMSRYPRLYLPGLATPVWRVPSTRPSPVWPMVLPPSRGTVWAGLMVSRCWRRYLEQVHSVDGEEEEQMAEYHSGVRLVFHVEGSATGLTLRKLVEVEVLPTGVIVYQERTCFWTKPILYLDVTRLAWADLNQVLLSVNLVDLLGERRVITMDLLQDKETRRRFLWIGPVHLGMLY